MTYIGEEFQKRFKTLPEDIQEALTAVASVDTIFAIGKKHGLMVDQIGKMADEIWKVMLGLANPKDFIRNLASALNIPSEKASAIASDVNAQMFQTVRESLRKIYDQELGITNKALDGSTSSLRAEQSEAKQSSGTQETAGLPRRPSPTLGTPRNDEEKIPPMIYPQDRFEEEFKKPIDESRIMNHELRQKQETESKEQKAVKQELPKQLAPLPPAVIASDQRERSNPAETNGIAEPVQSAAKDLSPRNDKDKKDDFTYPEKTTEVHREPAAVQGSYKGRDPYRESTEE